ncbi:sodium ion-translocating decarboxylase subunit beta, partial [Klebsiella pneumoniae]
AYTYMALVPLIQPP